jgi:tetratricopeptide (TPR) repeat protein
MLCLALAFVAPAALAQKKPTAATPEDLMEQAEAKSAAGDVEGALELLRRAAALGGASGEPALRLGRLLESRFEMDSAIDAYKGAAEKLSGAAKGEALGRLAVAQEMRGSPEAAASAEAAAAADPEGVWTMVAMARGGALAG